MLRTLRYAALMLALASLGVAAQQAGKITISQAYARATAPGQPAGGGYLKLDNQGAADRLIAARAPVAASVELHVMRMEGEVMRMREVEAIELPAGQAVELKPGGLHLMLMGLKAPLQAGISFPLTLTFEKAGEVTVQMGVSAPTP